MGTAGRTYRWIEGLHPLIKDGVLALVLSATMLADLVRQEVPAGAPIRPADWLGYVLVAAMLLPLALRRIRPVLTYLVVLAATVAVAVLFYRPSSFGFGLIIATYSVARWCERRVSVVTLGVGLLFGVAIKVRAIAAGLDVAWFDWPLDASYFGAAWFLGDNIRTRLGYAQDLERNRRALAHQAVVEERARIARELHDALGHAISVMVLHAGGGEEMLDRDPARARRAFRSISEVGRTALDEMDRLVGLLRDSEAARGGQRLPKSIGRLIDGYRELGLEIHASVETEPAGVPSIVERSAFRIIEEALTNTIKHAGPTTAQVSLAYGDGEIHVRVRDHGGSPSHRLAGREPHEGRGLIGIRERVAMAGGDVIAGPHPDGGFIVSATLPYQMTARP